MANLMSEGQISSLDLEHLVNLCQQWQQKPWLKMFCRPNTAAAQMPDKPTFLLCYQTKWQQDLMKTYGNQMTLLDAAHRSMGRALPLFFLCVRANLSYMIVGVIVAQQETVECVEEALRIFKEWNVDWNPDCFLVDFCREEINAVSALFKDTKILLCDSHRERAWMKWMAKKGNGVQRSRSVVLNMLRKVALATTMEEHRTALRTLTDSQIWETCDTVRSWFSGQWMPEIEKWAHVFRTAGVQIAIKADNGLGRQRQFLIYRCLAGYKSGPLTDLMTVLHGSIFPDTYRKHMQVNVQCSEFYRKYSEDVPVFLRNRPREFITHVLRSLSSNLNGAHITYIDKERGIFQVKNECDVEQHDAVNLGADYPACTCEDWRTSLLPCKHICCIIRFVEGWGWEKMSLSYWNHLLFVLDPTLSSEFPDREKGDAGRPSGVDGRTALPAECADDPPQRTDDPPQRTDDPPQRTDDPPQRTDDPPQRTDDPPQRTDDPPQRTDDPPQRTDDPPHRTTALIQDSVQNINRLLELIPLIEDETYLSNLCNTMNALLEDAKRHVPKAPRLNVD